MRQVSAAPEQVLQFDEHASQVFEPVKKYLVSQFVQVDPSVQFKQLLEQAKELC